MKELKMTIKINSILIKFLAKILIILLVIFSLFLTWSMLYPDLLVCILITLVLVYCIPLTNFLINTEKNEYYNYDSRECK